MNAKTVLSRSIRSTCVICGIFLSCSFIYPQQVCVQYVLFGEDDQVGQRGAKLAHIDIGVCDKANRYAVERKSIMLFKNLIYLMEKCDKYIEYWNYRKENVHLYLLSKVEIVNLIKARRDVVKEIEEKIEFFENKKREYALFLGKLYLLAEPFIEGICRSLPEAENNRLVNEFVQKIDGVLPEKYSDNYFNDELREIKKFAPESHPKNKVKRYALSVVGTVVAVALLYHYRKSVYNLLRNFMVNQVFKPLRNLKNCLFKSYDDHDFLDMSVEEMLKDLEAQKDVLRKKIKDLVVATDPQVEREYLDGLIEQAKAGGLEGFVAKCIKKARKSPVRSGLKQSKPGWIEWLLIGNRIRDALGMSPREKLLEMEIKGLLSRLAATKLLAEAKDGIDSNKLSMILGSLLPVALTTVGGYKLCNKIYEWYNGIPKKKKDINAIMFRISDIINRNIGKAQMSYQDQGFICYLTRRFKDCLSVVPDNIRSSFEKDLYYISSSANTVDKKMQILQSMKIMLYNC